MKVFKIEDVKEFMQLLFLKENFDKFCLGGMELKTLVTFAIKGNLCADWLTRKSMGIWSMYPGSCSARLHFR